MRAAASTDDEELPAFVLNAASAFVEKSPKKENAFAWLGRVTAMTAVTTNPDMKNV